MILMILCIFNVLCFVFLCHVAYRLVLFCSVNLEIPPVDSGSPRPLTNSTPLDPGGGGGGGTLIFSAYVGSDPASTVHPQKISGILSTPKNILIFSNPKNIPILYLDLKKKTLNCIEMTLKLAQFCDDPQKNIHKILIPPKKYSFF